MFIYVYKKPDTVQKAGQFVLSFYSQKRVHFTLRDFHEIFEIVVYIYTTSKTLCVT